MNTLSYTATASITPPRPLVPGTVRRNLNPYGEGWKVSKQSTSTKQQPRPPPTPFGGTLLPSLPPWIHRGHPAVISWQHRASLVVISRTAPMPSPILKVFLWRALNPFPSGYPVATSCFSLVAIFWFSAMVIRWLSLVPHLTLSHIALAQPFSNSENNPSLIPV